MSATLFCLTLLLAPTADAVDRLLDQAARFYDGAERYDGFEEDMAAAQTARRDLIVLASSCPTAEWAAMRDQLTAGLQSQNRGVWLACCQALSRRDPDALAAALLAQIGDESDSSRADLAASALAGIGGRLSPDTCGLAAAVLAERIEDLSRPCDRHRLVTALGSMKNAATDHLLRIAADPGLLELVGSALLQALASTEDARAMAALLSLHQGAVSDGQRTSSVLALGHLVRRIDPDEPLVNEAIASIRSDFESHSSLSVAAAAALALARAGNLAGAADAARVVRLAEHPAGRENALRAVIQSRIMLNNSARQVIEAYAQDEDSSPGARKVAHALAAE